MSARESNARTGRFLREKLRSLTTVIFVPTRAKWSGERARFVGLFQGCTGLSTAGRWLACRLHQLKASTTMDLRVGISIFLIFVRCVALRNLELLIKIGWNVSFVRFVAENAGRGYIYKAGDNNNNPSRSRLLSIWSKGGLVNRFVIGRCHRL